MAQFQVYLLNQFRLESDGQPVRLPTRKAEVLLACLILHPAWHTRDRLITLFWGDFPEARARTSLRVALSALRKSLGAAGLLTDQDGVKLNPEFPIWVDALA